MVTPQQSFNASVDNDGFSPGDLVEALLDNTLQVSIIDKRICIEIYDVLLLSRGGVLGFD